MGQRVRRHRGGVMQRALLHTLPFALILSLALIPNAAAVTIESDKPFAYTRSGAVQWQTTTDLTTSVVIVKNTSLQIGNREYDFAPYSGKQILVKITQWTDDGQAFSVSMRSGSTTGLNITLKNPGFTFNVLQNGVLSQTCGPTTTTCSFTFAAASTHVFSIIIPTADAIATFDGASTSSSGGGAGVSDALAAIREDRFEFVDPIQLFPTLNRAQWGGIVVGMVSLFSGFPRTRLFVPAPVRSALPIPAPMLVAIGLLLLAYVYFDASAAFLANPQVIE